MADEGKPLRGMLILLIEDSEFRAAYVGSAITSAGAQLLGPARSAEEAKALLLQLRIVPLAAVVCTKLFDADGGEVREALARLGAPLLLLAENSRPIRPFSGRHDVLVAPFGAYQVVEHLISLHNRAVPIAPQPSSGPLMRGH